MTALVLFGMAVSASPASASEASVTVSGGSLGLATVPIVHDFVQVTLTGRSEQTYSELDDFTVIDGRGTGEGWVLTMAATPFREWDGTAYVPGGKSLPTGSLSMPALTAIPVETLAAPPWTEPSSLHLDGASVVVARAGRDEGMGTYRFTTPEPLVLTVPASAYAGTYRSDLSISVTSGP